MKSLLRQLVRRIPTRFLKVTLEKWGRLTVAQQQNIDFTQTKWALADELIAYSEVHAAVKCTLLLLGLKKKLFSFEIILKASM